VLVGSAVEVGALVGEGQHERVRVGSAVDVGALVGEGQQ